jgi:hypothetical protein
MEPKNLHFGGGPTESVVHPAILLLVFVIGVLILYWPRRKVIAPFLAASILIPFDQVLVVGGLHFQMIRVLALFGMIRLVWQKFSRQSLIFSGGINRIDIAVIGLAISIAVAGVLLFREMAVVTFQLGNLYTVFGLYFLTRSLIRDRKDIVCMVRALAYGALVIAMIMIWETATGHNPYALLGGAKAASYANLAARDDRFRAQGCFGHSILAGTFGAINLPLFVLLWKEDKKYRATAAIGIASATVIVATSNSSTPVLAYAGGVLALCLWPLRAWMRPIRWGIVFTLVLLHMVMKAPVWHLISRIDISGGSSSYHRYMLIDQCIRHFGDWWLLGVKSTKDWGWDMWDTANQYVGTCDNSGLLPFLLFIATIVCGFKYLGRARRLVSDKKGKLFLWSLGAALFANVVAFFGISYWDQTQMVWYSLLAAISTAAVVLPDSKPVPARVLLHKTDWADQVADANGDPLRTHPSLDSEG